MSMNVHAEAPLSDIPEGATHYDQATHHFFKERRETSEVMYWENGNWVHLDKNNAQIFIECVLPQLVKVTRVGTYDELRKVIQEVRQSEQEVSEESSESMATLYPAYYKDVSMLNEIDVYATHHLFQIDDPSGCIQHASKKLLLCGQRTGGKDPVKEIREARDTLTRKLQLMGAE